MKKKLIGMYDASVPETVEFDENGNVTMLHWLEPLEGRERLEVTRMLMKQTEDRERGKIKNLNN